MYNNKAQTLALSLISVLSLFLLIFLNISEASLELIPLIIILVPVVFLITLVNTDAALILLIFSMLLSPEFKLVEVPQRAVVLRVDDILLIVVFFSWFAKTAIRKELGFLRQTPLNPLIMGYILISVISTAFGILTGNINPLKSYFYILKYVEYFMLYFLVTNNLRDKKQIKAFLAAFLITCILTCSYALLTLGKNYRASAPFEGPMGEPNTLGGYLIILFALVAGIFLYSPSKRWRISCLGIAPFLYITLIYTLSRGSYLGSVFMYLTLIILTRRKRILLIGVLILAVVAFPVILPKVVKQRITKTFIPGEIYEPFGTKITLDTSAASRVESWKRVFELWKRRPIFGYGVTGVGLIDTQYPLVLGETGVVGFFIFIWLLMTILRHSLYIFNNIDDDWAHAISLGFLAGFIGLLVHAFAANTFIIVRIMEPFWFLAAIIVSLPRLSHLDKEEAPVKEI